MKTIRIFALPSHLTKERITGVDFARVVQPMKALDGFEYEGVKFEVEVYDPNKEELTSDPLRWSEIMKKTDIVYFNYLNNPWGFAAMGAMARANNVKIIMDLDDNLHAIKSDNPAHKVYHKGSQAINDFTSICNEVDWMTTTNDYLKHAIMNNTNKKAWEIKVFPNYVDLDLYNHKPEFKHTDRIQLTHYGSTTHFVDLLDDEFGKGIDKILKEYPNVSIKMVGAFLPKYKEKWGQRYEVAYGNEDIYKWINDKFREYMDETDIMVVPLSNDIYNRCKSSIKFIESASAGKPGIWQRIRQYEEVIEDGKNGYLASKDTEWYKAIKSLIDDVELRRKMGEEAYETVRDDWQMKEHLKDYAAFFKAMMI